MLKEPRLGERLAGSIMNSMVNLTSRGGERAAVVKVNAGFEVEDVGEGIGSFPRFG